MKIFMLTILLQGISTFTAKYTYASLAEYTRLEESLSPLKKKRVDITDRSYESEKENFTAAKQAYEQACEWKKNKQWEAAFKKMKEAAKLGSAAAQFGLYVDYQVGRGCNKNMKKAVDWCQRSAAQGYPLALNSLGSMYELGNEYVEKDWDQALDYYKAAMDKGVLTAMDNLDRLLKDMGY
jgi:TPR repeat protein